jgi:hypothetical protein
VMLLFFWVWAPISGHVWDTCISCEIMLPVREGRCKYSISLQSPPDCLLLLFTFRRSKHITTAKTITEQVFDDASSIRSLEIRHRPSAAEIHIMRRTMATTYNIFQNKARSSTIALSFLLNFIEIVHSRSRIC